MINQRTAQVGAVISYIETHLEERLDLDRVAEAAGYSKYHLHRMFTDTAGLTFYSYIRRRRLTEAARRLVCSPLPVAEIALLAGYESQQAFTSSFKAMYKRTPGEYRRRGRFYPLQLKLALEQIPAPPEGAAYARREDLTGWMDFVSPVAGGFPGLEETSHLEQVRRHIGRRQVLVVRAGSTLVGAAAFSRRRGSIDFLAARPQYRRWGVTKALLEAVRREAFPGRAVSITTFRAGDRADPGQRAEYLALGFLPAELCIQFGYPVQRLVLPAGQEVRHG